MKTTCSVVYAMMFFLPTIVIFSSTSLLADSQMVQDLQRKIADGLMSIRKEYPASQPRIYAMLDQLDKLCSLAKNGYQEAENLKKELSDKHAENSSLKKTLSQNKQDLLSIKKTVESAKSSLDQKLEEERLRVQQLTQERDKLLQKIAVLEAPVAKQVTKDDGKGNELLALSTQKNETNSR